MTATTVQLLNLYPVLNELPDTIRDQCLAEAKQLVVPGNTSIFEEGHPCTGFPLVISGSIRVLKSTKSGREIPLYRVFPGESCLITTTCLLGRIAYSARGFTEEETQLLLLPGKWFDELASFTSFRGFLFQLLADRMADMMQLVEEVSFQRLDQRLANILLGKGAHLQVTHQQLADELGSVREMVSRILETFSSKNWVRLGRGKIEILDPAALRVLTEER
ncbi:Crp/Fnr family transcriptional regulator [Undibacterium sp. SXout20W]|uniref:Crp/Fnr family transcriptional regulator n=1 Tax=Undibacterium sp. SXout20W TaxID=3413051 RepID=UPI003BF205C3